jgi:hypothetical protein
VLLTAVGGGGSSGSLLAKTGGGASLSPCCRLDEAGHRAHAVAG